MNSKVSTIVASIDLKSEINFNLLINKFGETSDKIIDILCTNFTNQLTMIVNIDKRINLKIFSNGKIQITGLSENYLFQLNEIYKLFKNYDNSIIHSKDINVILNEFNLLVNSEYYIIGYNIAKKMYNTIGFIKKNDKIFINNEEIIPFDSDRFMLTTKHHKDKIKNLYSNNGVLIGNIEYKVVGCISQKELPEYEQHLFKPIGYNNFLYFYSRKIKNLILKNKKISKINDSLYVVYNKFYNNQKISINNLFELDDSTIFKYKKFIYCFIHVSFNEKFTSEKEYFENEFTFKPNLLIQETLFKTEIADSLDYTLFNINTDLSIHKKNILHENFNLHNLKSILHENSLHTNSDSLKYSICYEPSKYPALKLNFIDLKTSIRLFRSFKCKISSNNFDNIKIVEDFIINIINKFYDKIVIKNINTENIIKESLSIDDFI